jgi:hypothetical protein
MIPISPFLFFFLCPPSRQDGLTCISSAPAPHLDRPRTVEISVPRGCDTTYVKLVKSHINSYFQRAGGSLKPQPRIYRSPQNHFQRIHTKVCIKVLNLFEPTPRMTELPKKAIVVITCQTRQHTL